MEFNVRNIQKPRYEKRKFSKIELLGMSGNNSNSSYDLVFSRDQISLILKEHNSMTMF